MRKKIGLRASEGFTLIEVMVAMLIVAVAMLALGGLLIHSMRTNQASEERIDAAAVSRAVLNDYAARILAGQINAAGTFTGARDGYGYVLNVSKAGSNWVLHVVLKPVQGGRLPSFENTTVISTSGSCPVDRGAGMAA